MQHLSTHAQTHSQSGSQHRQRHITPHTELESHHQLTPVVKKLIRSIHTRNKGLIYYSVAKTISPAAELHILVNKSERGVVFLIGMWRGDPVTGQCCIDSYEMTMRAVCDLYIYYLIKGIS